METDPKKYEIAYLISPSVNEDGVVEIAGKVSGIIQDANGAVTKIEEPKKVKLAYPIKKSRNAYFGWTRFSAQPEGIDLINKKLRFDADAILRYLIVEEEEHQEIFRRAPRLKTVAGERPVGAIKREAEKSEEKIDVEQLDKKLEEILNK
ncbi:MAG: 30S ribosomal protein S6 [Candidatus Sungbacteria bacterium RIFCSPLOWO2_02_FULL_51_17]|nr:MAG: 30S ribosomal protein S6 [Candidatus Sungbacteria bacterium RIFCSPHIGHO2_01_FULL_51_22]OHA04598.1 MAG: 30S ribosomal protein S6 [Candidatus Sungbacteria bacterium RIFCSPLOWO2_01_FULL_51_34]OHA12284.1 MAG: 30S ribosomal protein S6 [Candidatus Sungbacteria bacterium RIFCSPLOWO2_02_FULL_51_17]